jgi:hypothetical protein
VHGKKGKGNKQALQFLSHEKEHTVRQVTCLLNLFMDYLKTCFAKYYSGYQLNNNDIGEAGDRYGVKSGNLMERNYLEDLGANVTTILKWIFKKT